MFTLRLSIRTDLIRTASKTINFFDRHSIRSEIFNLSPPLNVKNKEFAIIAECTIFLDELHKHFHILVEQVMSSFLPLEERKKKDTVYSMTYSMEFN